MLSLAVILTLVITWNSALAFSGATVPWTTYEAENMTNTGTILGPLYGGNNVASESSGRRCVQLSTNGAFVQFTAQTNANAIVVRYSVPDTANGVGTNYTLSLYTNGVFAAKLPVNSLYSWLYGGYSFTNNPGSGSPRNFLQRCRRRNNRRHHRPAELHQRELQRVPASGQLQNNRLHQSSFQQDNSRRGHVVYDAGR